MSRKKVIFLLVSLFVFSLVSTIGLAAPTDYMPDILENFFKWLFFTLPEQARSGDEAFVIYFKLILWLLMFPIIFFGANKIFPDSRRISSVIAGVFSLIAVIFIPKGVLIFIFTEFSAVTSLILALAPIFIGIFVRSKIPDDLPMLKNGIMIIVGVILIITGGYFTAAALTGEGDKLFEQFGVWSSALGAVALLWGIFGFLFGFGLGKGGGEGGGSFGRGSLPEEKAAQREKEEEAKEERDKQMEAKVDANLMKLNTEMKQLEEKLEKLDSDEMVQIVASLSTYQKQEELLKLLRSLLVGTWTIDAELGRLLSGLNKQPQYYREKMGEVQQAIEKYRGFVAKLIQVVEALRTSLEGQKIKYKYIEDLEKYGEDLLNVMKKCEKLEVRDLRKVRRFEWLIRAESGKLVEISKRKKSPKVSIEKKALLELRKERTQAMFTELNEIKKMIKGNKSLKNFFKQGADKLRELKDFDEKDINLCTRIINFLTQFSLIGTAIEVLRNLGRLRLLKERDIRFLYTGVNEIFQHTQRKVTLLQEYQKLNIDETRMEQDMEKMTGNLSRIDQYFATKDIRAINDIRATRP